ncbi:MAG: leucine-rich repeat protein [Treponema sp.]|jgi:TPR repeat protein|nr:leucine-rich repeat protein [Treponema sp.]
MKRTSTLFKNVDLHRFFGTSGENKPLVKKAVKKVEKRLEFSIPQAYLELLSVKNGDDQQRKFSQSFKDMTGFFSLVNLETAKEKSILEEAGYPPIGIYFAVTLNAEHEALVMNYREIRKNKEPSIWLLDLKLKTGTLIADTFEEFIEKIVAIQGYPGEKRSGKKEKTGSREKPETKDFFDWINDEEHFENKDGTTNYPKLAKRLMEKAERGDDGCQYHLGSFYQDGIGVEQSYEKAFYWFTKAAEQGHTDAMVNLGVCYFFGRSVEKDYKKAVSWWNKAEKNNGSAWAQNNLGNRYYNGEGVEQSFKKAAAYWTKAAKQGHAGSQNMLGSCYEKGEGVTQDYTEAVRWYQKSAKQGNEDAKKSLEELSTKLGAKKFNALCVETEENYTPGLTFYPVNNGKGWTIGGSGYKDGGPHEAEELIIPATHKGLPVIKISNFALQSYRFTKITLPNTLTHIAEHGMSGCSNFTNLMIPANVTTIESGLTSGCNSLTSIDIDRSNKVYRSENNCVIKDKTLIAGCRTSIIPDGITYIAAGAFHFCRYLTHITIPEGVTRIGDHAFCGCENLKTLVLPASLKRIESLGFSGCDSLHSIFYCGDAEKLKTIKMVYYTKHTGNSDYTHGQLYDADLYFYSETKPAKKGNYWHFSDSGKPLVW